MSDIDMRNLGSTGLKRFSGFVQEEFLRELIGHRGTAIYREMSENDPTVAAMIFTITMLCRQATWRVKPASEALFDKEAAEFLDSCRDDMSHTWNDMIVEILSMLVYGYDIQELVYKRRCGDSSDPTMKSKHSDGRIGWRKISTRSQDTIYRWRFDDNGGIQGAEQIAPPHYNNTFLPIEKILLFRTTTQKNNPEGKSILRGAYRAWYMKKNMENIEAIGVERDLAGLPMAYVPPEILSQNASQAQKAVLANIENIVKNVRRDEQEGIVFPMAYDASGKLMYDFKLLSSGGSRSFDTDKIINRYDQRIAMTCLADFILLGHAQSNGLNLATQKTSIFTAAIGAYMQIIADVLNRYAVPRLFKLNPDILISQYPKFEVGDIDSVDLNEIGNYIQKLSQSGMPLFPNMDLEKYLMKVAGMPEPMDSADQAPDMGLDVQSYQHDPLKDVKDIVDNPNGGPMDVAPYADTTPPPGDVVTNDGIVKS